MPSVTIKDIPHDLLERLRQQAAKDKRSINREVIYLLDVALSHAPIENYLARPSQHIDTQIQAWRQLAGRWESDLEPSEEIEQIYANRTGGRQVEL